MKMLQSIMIDVYKDFKISTIVDIKAFVTDLKSIKTIKFLLS